MTVSAGLRTPSSTRLLADRLADAAVRALEVRGLTVDAGVVELREHARDLTGALVTGVPAPAVDDLLGRVSSADEIGRASCRERV